MQGNEKLIVYNLWEKSTRFSLGYTASIKFQTKDYQGKIYQF